MDMKKLMKQAQQMQGDLAKKQEELGNKTYEASAGGGMVVATVSGKHEIVSLKIDPTIVSSDDVDMLQDLVIAAVNEGFSRVNEDAQNSLSGMMGGMGGLPNFFG